MTSPDDWPLLTRTLTFNEVLTDGGMVVAPDPFVAEAGATVLRGGGNAVDAAVAAAFAEGVAEPPMSGLGGSATMTIALRDPGRFAVIEGHMVAPFEATPDRYPLAEKQPERKVMSGGWSVTFFDRPVVEGNLNLIGPQSVTTPGAVAALLAAQERYGRLPRAKVLEPAIAMAADGVPINWFVAACTASDVRLLARDPGCADLFLPRGAPLRGPCVLPASTLRQPALARTLEAIAAEGAEVFYRGRIGESIVRTVRDEGGLLSMADLARYEPTVTESPAPARYGPIELVASPSAGFPTVLEALGIYDEAVRQGTDVAEGMGPDDDPVAWARALKLAFEDRFATMTVDPSMPVPWEAFRSREYARARLAAALAGDERPDPFAYSTASASAAGSSGRPGEAGHTSQIAAVDRDGNMVSLTSTILADYGARLLDPETGVLLNNGMAYFDTTPGSVNGIRPGVQVLSAMTPVVLVDDARGPFAAVGASGGWRIISGIAQIVAALAAGGTSLQGAIEAPRIHAETDTVLLDVRWGRAAGEALAAAGFTPVPVVEEPTTAHFARPGGVLIDADGKRHSGVDPLKPGGVALD